MSTAFDIGWLHSSASAELCCAMCIYLLRYSSAANVTRRDAQRRLFLLMLAWLVAVGSVSVAIALVVILWYLYHP